MEKTNLYDLLKLRLRLRKGLFFLLLLLAISGCGGGNNISNNSDITLTITTIAGNGNPGYSGDGNAAINAGLSLPYSVALDNSGNLYISDTENNRIRMVDTFNKINTIAGDGSETYDSGINLIATTTGVDGPGGIAVDGHGNIYATPSCVVRKITPTGYMSTIAGNGNPGLRGDGGLANMASLWNSCDVAVDDDGNIYIADTWNNRIRKVDTSGIINTIAGKGSLGHPGYSGDGGFAVDAELNNPIGVAVDSTGNVYIADYYNHCIRKVNTSGKISTIAGTGTSGYSGDGDLAINAKLNHPRAVAVDALGNVYIADSLNNRIRKIDASGKISTIAGTGLAGYSGDNGNAINAKLYCPCDVAVDASGNIYIADTSNNRIRKLH